jgi:hypothetical protein
MSTQPTRSGPGPWQTPSIGNAKAGRAFDQKSTTSTVRTIGVIWDGDKLRGIKLELFDGTSWKYGGYDDADYKLGTYTFTSGELLKTLTLRDSVYGNGSVRRIGFTTSLNREFQAGEQGFGHEVNPNVEHCVLVGVFGAVNEGNFINELGFWIQIGSLSVDDLYSLDDSQVRTAVSDLFVRQLKHSRLIHDTFFWLMGPLPPEWWPQPTPAFLDITASALACSSIGSSALYGFSRCVNVPAAIACYQSQLATADAVKWGQMLYYNLFPDNSRSANASFRDYMNDGAAKWAQALAAKVTTSQFVDEEMAKVLSQPNWLEHLNLVFFKLKRLTQSDEPLQSVLQVWTKAYPDKGIVQNWENQNFIPPQNFSQLPDEFLSAVNAAISVSTLHETRIVLHHGRRSTYIYGSQVQKFLDTLLVHLGSTFGMVTGAAPDNWRTVTG